jgi:hypothetical protein
MQHDAPEDTAQVGMSIHMINYIPMYVAAKE